jgi:RNA polymerase sigma factor (sigma-70 family)
MPVEIQPETNDALVTQLIEDHESAWTEWYETAGGAAVKAFVKTINDTAETDEDITHEAIATAYIEIRSGKYEARIGVPLSAYVKGIARNKIREARRRAWRTQPLEAIPPATLDGDATRVEALIERREQIFLLKNGLAHLSPRRRRVLEGYLNGQTTEEIADSLGITREMVRQHRCRGVRNLQEMVEQANRLRPRL